MELKFAQLLLKKIAFSLYNAISCLLECLLFCWDCIMIPQIQVCAYRVRVKRDCIAGGYEVIELRQGVSTVTRKMQNSTAGLMMQ